jgi:3-hydroxyacyl-CoA dehydrogenase
MNRTPGGELMKETKEIRRVVVLGANGTMGSGAGALFAARGYDVVMLARDAEKAEAAVEMAKQAVRSDAIGERIRCAGYDELETHVAEADLVLECVAERLDLKQRFFERVDASRRPGSWVATVSSGLSIAAMAEGRSDDFRRHFMGMHLFNPPNVIVGTELIPGPETDRIVFGEALVFLEKHLGRVVVECRDQPAFAGNRVGFKVLNEVAQLAAEHGVAVMDYLIGPHTGRALSPLLTVDLVGLDVHQAIVDNVYDKTNDEAHEAFALPDYMKKLIAQGHLGLKTAEAGGLYRTLREKGGARSRFVLDPGSGDYRPLTADMVPRVDFVEEMKALHRVGRYAQAMQLFLEAEGPEAELARRVVLGYVSYGLNRVGPDEVVDRPLDVDLIMGYGFNWAPPSVLVDLFGRDRAIAAMEQLELPVPDVVAALSAGQSLFVHPETNVGRYFVAR